MRVPRVNASQAALKKGGRDNVFAWLWTALFSKGLGTSSRDLSSRGRGRLQARRLIGEKQAHVTAGSLPLTATANNKHCSRPLS